MKYPTIQYRFDRRHKADKTTKGVIEVEVLFRGTRKWFSTGVSVLPSQWDNSLHIVNHIDCVMLNLRIAAVRKPIDDFVKQLIISDKPFSFEKLTQTIFAEKYVKERSFAEFVEETINSRADIRESTKQAQRRILGVLAKFGKIDKFSDLTRQNIQLLEEWLRQQGLSTETIRTYHKIMKNYIRKAIIRGLLDKDPYEGIRLKHGKPAERRYLTEEELERLRQCDNLSPALQKVRDLFVFQAYTGMAYAELAAFDFSKVTKRGERYFLTGTRQKSGEPFYIPLLHPVIDVLKKYDYTLPMMTNQQYNLRLNAVADIAGIDKHLTSHMARHTAACMLLNHGVPIEVVAKVLGHSDIKTTQIYAKIVNQTVDAIFANLDKSLS